MLSEKEKLAAGLAPVLRMSSDRGGKSYVFYAGESDLYRLVCEKLGISGGALAVNPDADLMAYFAKSRVRMAYINGVGLFTLGKTPAEAKNLSAAFTGGEARLVSGNRSGRMAGKIVVVTGAAQGFGRAIAEGFAREGAYVVVSDLNPDGAKAVSDAINSEYGFVSASVGTDVSVESDVEELCARAALTFGGIDVFISCAGIVKAGGLSELSGEDFDRITRVNYNGFYYCTKYSSAVMRLENSVSPGYFTDIIEINSKSGLLGSMKNFAYAGSKFGGIGLVESFALELAAQRTKVNAVCPGNYLDGKLWSDPEKGLLKQYLEAGKVTGAKNIGDVRRYYESKVPLGRGCRPEDVLRAVFYLVEQEYETGQALPVTGGQEMLK